MNNTVERLWKESLVVPSDEHVDDAGLHREGIEKAKALAGAFVAENAEALQYLIGVWSDITAEAMLSALREDFWGHDWKPGAKP